MKKLRLMTIVLMTAGCGTPNAPAQSNSSDSAAKTPDNSSVKPATENAPAAHPQRNEATEKVENPESSQADDTKYVHCDSIELMGSCEQREKYNVGSLQNSCLGLGLEMVEGPCPKENLMGSCEADGIDPMYLYKPMISTEEQAKRRCAQTTFIPSE